ncbi:MAG: MFS transporter [Streptosporangiaceae bacterium]|jgi:MFS family permease
MRLSSRAGVLRERNFRRFYIGYSTSLLGTAMSPIAIAWAVLASGGGAADLGFVMTANVVPQVVLMAFAGAIADRFGRRRVMLSADVFRCLGRVALAGVLLAGHPALWLFIMLALLSGTGDAFFSPALGALTVEIAPADQLGDANAMYGLATSIARIGGPALSGIVVAFAGPAAVVALDAASFAVSAVALASLRFAAPGKSAGDGSLLRDMADGWTDFRSRTWLWTITVQFAFFNLITWSPWMVLGPVAGHDYLGGSGVWGAIMAAQGAGAVAGSLACLGRKPRRPLVVATIATICYALPDIPMALHAGALLVAPAAFMCGIGSVVSGTLQSTVLQQQIPRDRLARVSALGTFPAYGIGITGYAIDGPLSTVVGATALFAVGAVYGVLGSLVVLATPAIRAVRWRDEPPRALLVNAAPTSKEAG